MIQKPRGAKKKKQVKKVVISQNELENAVGTKVANDIDQSMNESETGAGDGDSSFAFGDS